MPQNVGQQCDILWLVATYVHLLQYNIRWLASLYIAKSKLYDVTCLQK